MLSVTYCVFANTWLSLLGRLLKKINKIKIKAQVRSTPRFNYMRTDKTLIHRLLCEKQVQYLSDTFCIKCFEKAAVLKRH